MTRYTIRYRCEACRGPTTLVVDDRQGTAYVFSEGQLQVRLTGDDACARLVQLLERRAVCVPVPEVDPYTLDRLGQLTQGALPPAGAEAAVADDGAWTPSLAARGQGAAYR